MPLVSILSVNLKADRIQDYQNEVAGLAQRARETSDPFHWTTHESVYGEMGRIHFAASSETFDALGQRGLTPMMVARVLGEQRGMEAMRLFGECTQSLDSSISIDRPDLSYAPDDAGEPSPAVVITLLHARPGHQDACEELIRKIAEAIPKVGDPARLTAFQTVMGDLSQYWTARPIQSLADLDQQLPPPKLLDQAFGPAEGGLIFRTGVDAIESATRSVLVYREDLSNPG